MLSVIIMIILLVGAAAIGSIYSSFLVFYDNFSETQNYNKAYYASIASLERAELVIKQRNPGYEGSAGWTNGYSSGLSIAGGLGAVDGIMSGFSYLSSLPTSSFWQIKSLTNRIPSTGQGNIDGLLAADDSSNYNMMDYDNSEIFLLYKDKSDGNPYTGGSTKKSNVSSINGKIRLPKKIKTSFGENKGLLNITESLMRGGIKDDAIVDWQVNGYYNNNPFTLYATQRTNVSKSSVIAGDSAIRESDINTDGGVNVSFSNNLSPVSPDTNPYTIISSDELVLSGKTFNYIFQSNDIQNLQLKLSLLNLLYSQSQQIYPFLEYYFTFNGESIPDKYYTINSEGKVGDFQVNLVFKKPTISQSVLGAFTVIF